MNGINPIQPTPPPALERQIKGFKTGGLRTKNPFYYLSGSIAASQKRKVATATKLAKAPK